MGSLWRSAHELCFIWKSGEAPHVNRVELGRNGRNRSNVWEYPGANSFSSQDDREGRAHVTTKNLAMIKDAILDVSRPGDIVLDSFVGSGTTCSPRTALGVAAMGSSSTRSMSISRSAGWSPAPRRLPAMPRRA